MENKKRIAPTEDVISAIELIYEEKYVDLLISEIFGIDAALSLINFGNILDTDKVIAIGSHMDIITWLISYIYIPHKLSLITDTSCYTGHIEYGNIDVSSSIKKYKSNIRELLQDYVYSEPIVLNHDLPISNYMEEYFDVVIMGFSMLTTNTIKAPFNRFLLEAGTEFAVFKKYLVKYGALLKIYGRLILLAKPGWILSVWELIHELGLQLEYDYYKLYTDSIKHPNVFIWLCFVKKQGDLNLEFHKKNLISLLEDNFIDRLYAHRNNLRFPYVELSYSNSEAYVKLDQNLEYMQYFFSLETTINLSMLCEGYTACLVTPSIAQYAYKMNKKIVLFDRDNRFRDNGGMAYVKYDLNIGLTKFLRNKYAKKFDRVICDPPFDITLDALAYDIDELLKDKECSIAYIVFPDSRKTSLINAMKRKGFVYQEYVEKISIEYAKPPKLVRIAGKDAIRLYKFAYQANSIVAPSLNT